MISRILFGTEKTLFPKIIIVCWPVNSRRERLDHDQINLTNVDEELILEIQQVIKFSTDKMKLVDTKGHYESDDETGFFFEQLKQIQLSLDGIFEEETRDAKKRK